MALIIQNEQVERIVAAMAEQAGITCEEAAAKAIWDHWNGSRPELNADASPDRPESLRDLVRRLSDKLSQEPVSDGRPLEEILYDENGLPRGW